MASKVVPNPPATEQAVDQAKSTNRISPSAIVAPATPISAEENPAVFHLAFQRVEAEIRAVPHERLMPINFDVRSVLATILGAFPEIIALRPEFVKLPVALEKIDKLPDYALALGHTQARLTLSVEQGDDLATLAAEGVVARDRLHADATALSKRDVVRPELVDRLKNGISYKNIAFDLVGLAELFVDVWDKLAGKSFVTSEEVERARVIGSRMMQLLGLREQAPAVRDQAAVLRQQAYLLCADAYEEARHAVSFVRRKEGDAESIAPSLFANRGVRTPRSESDSEPPAVTPNAPSPAAPFAAAPTNPGVRGGDPFL